MSEFPINNSSLAKKQLNQKKLNKSPHIWNNSPKPIHMPTHESPNAEPLDVFSPSTLDYGHHINYIKNVNPNDINTEHQSSGQALANQLKPLDPTIPYNVDQFANLPSEKFDIKKDQESIDRNREDIHSDLGHGKMSTLNFNADIGAQQIAQNLREKEILVSKDENGNEKPAYVLISSGHSPAIARELGSWTTKDNNGQERYLYDTSVYAPKGEWTDNATGLKIMTYGAQMWGDQIAKDKERIKQEGLESAGGVAIALNGHRGDSNHPADTEKLRANINPNKMLGSPEKFLEDLKRRGLNRVVIATEHYIPHGQSPDTPNILSLEHLHNSEDLMVDGGFDETNKDLYDYMKKLEALDPDLEIIVVGVDSRIGNKKSEYH